MARSSGEPPRGSPKKRGGGSKRSRASKTSKKPAASRSKAKASSRSASSSRKRRKAPRPPARPPIGRWLRDATVVVVGGVVVGAVGAALVLFGEARAEVEAWAASPSPQAVSTVWSAPPLVRIGEPYPLAELVSDLRDAGYEQLTETGRPDSFVVRGGEVMLTRARQEGIGWVIPSGEARIRIEEGVVVSTAPAEGVSLRPVPLARVGDLERRRDPVTLNDLSPWMVPALLAIEDSRFHDHVGIDPVGITRALVHNVLSGNLQGGSTLTQQLAKNLFLGSERTLRRKVREVFLAAALEATLDKDALLELYLSEVYLGHHGGVPVHGVEQAARAWFGKSALHIDAAEAATIAGVIASPNVTSPLRSTEAALVRRDQVLRRMHYVRALTEAQLDDALRRPLVTVDEGPSAQWQAPWVVAAALDATRSAVGREAIDRGLDIHTTVQPHLQRAAQRALRSALAQVVEAHPDAAGAEGAVAVVRARDGDVLALVGGTDFIQSPFHRAVDAWRQAGSTVKPLTTAAALDLDRSLSPLSMLDDAPITRRHDGRSWSPRNYDGRHVGPINVAASLEQSRNIPAVLLAERVGRTRLQRFQQDVGLSRATDLPSAALGAFATTPLELAGAYTMFPAGGVVARPTLLTALLSADGQVLLQAEPQLETRVSPTTTAEVRAMLQGVLTHGTGRGAGLSGALGGKTGTTDDGRDAWFVGFDPHVVVAVWVGRDRGDLGLTGSQAALPVFEDYVRRTGLPRGDFPAVSNAVRLDVCMSTGEPPCGPCDDARAIVVDAQQAPARDCRRDHARAPDEGRADEG